jgi:hypothetical protein
MKTIARLASVALFGICSSASAAEFWTQIPGSGQLTWNGFDSGFFTRVDVTSYDYRGGQFAGFFNTDGTSNDDEFFRFFCIDLRDYANTGPHKYSASKLDNDLLNDPLARLFDIAYPNKELGDFYDKGPTNFGQFSSAIYSSAFQLAVWEIFYEAVNDFSMVGRVFNSNTVPNVNGTDAQKTVAQADAWLDLIDAGQGSASGWTLYKFTNDGQQDYLTAIYRPVPQADTPVPEPGTLAMLGLGIAALGAIRRRRQ